MLIYFNGDFVDAEQAKVGVLSPAITSGPIPYETLRGYWSEDARDVFLFRVDAHLKRLRDSMRVLRYRDLFDDAVLSRALVGLVERNGLREDVHFRLFVFPLEQAKGQYATTKSGIAIDVAPRRAQKLKPAKCCIGAWRRGGDDSQPSRVKAMGLRMMVRASMDQAITAGYDQVLLLNERGKLSESVSSNLFVVRDGEVLTPPRTASILEGVTRETLLALLADRGIPAVEREIDTTELFSAEEAFLCSTGKQIIPIASVDGLALGDGSPGHLTRLLNDAYLDAVRGKDPLHREWLLPVYAGASSPVVP